MRRFQINEISAVDVPAQEGALMTLLKKQPTRQVGKFKLTAKDFACTPSPKRPTLWKLRLADEPGKPTKELVDKAIANLKKIDIGSLPAALDKLREAWAKANDTNEDDEAMPKELKAKDTDNIAGQVLSLAAEGVFPGDTLKRYIDPSEGPKTFGEVIEICEAEEEYYETMRIAGHVVSALDTSLRSIVAAKDMDNAEKQNAMRSSVEEFLARIREEMPEVEEVLDKALKEATEPGGSTMTKLVAKAKVRKAEGEEEEEEEDMAEQLKTLTAKVEELTGANTKLSADNAHLQGQLAVTSQVAGLDAGAAKHYKGLKDETAKAAFLKLDASAQAEEVRKATEGDETVMFEGVSYSKKADPTFFGFVKAQAAKTAKLEKALEVEREARQAAEFAKRANEELASLPGTEAEKIAVLKAMDGMGDEGKKALTSMLKAANGIGKLAFERLGSAGVLKVTGNGAPVGSDEDFEEKAAASFEKRINEVKKRDKCTSTEAMERAALEYPKEYEEWQTGEPIEAAA
jgi:hypothetical protein